MDKYHSFFDGLRRDAKKLLKELRAKNKDAQKRLITSGILPLVSHLGPDDIYEKIKLKHAQLIIAKERGFNSWNELVKADPFVIDMTALTKRHFDSLKSDNWNILERLVEKVGLKTIGAHSIDDAKDKATLNHVRLLYAIESGFESWNDYLKSKGTFMFFERVDSLSYVRHKVKDNPANPDFWPVFLEFDWKAQTIRPRWLNPSSKDLPGNGLNGHKTHYRLPDNVDTKRLMDQPGLSALANDVLRGFSKNEGLVTLTPKATKAHSELDTFFNDENNIPLCNSEQAADLQLVLNS